MNELLFLDGDWATDASRVSGLPSMKTWKAGPRMIESMWWRIWR